MIHRKKHAYKLMKCGGKVSDIQRYRALNNTERGLTRKDHGLYLDEITFAILEMVKECKTQSKSNS